MENQMENKWYENLILCLTLVLLVLVVCLAGITLIGIFPLLIFAWDISDVMQKLYKSIK